MPVFFLKIIVTVILVLVLSLVAEYVSPQVAGILAGFPLGAAIALFFIGLELGTDFVSNSAIYTLIGLIATQSFVYCYYQSTLHLRRFSIPISSAISIVGYFMVIWLLHFLKINKWLSILFPIISIGCFIYLFRGIQNIKIENRIKLTGQVLFLRAFLAAFIILIITGAAKSVSPVWAGLFSAFPVTLFPLILIVHFTYDKPHVHTIIKNFPRGLGALIVYSLSVSILYPMHGIYVGTMLSLMSATGYLFIYGLINILMKERR